MLDTAARPPQVGDILCESWGYDQTNIDYYEVVGLTASGASARIRKIGAARITEGSPYLMPTPGAYIGDVTKTKRVQDAGAMGGYRVRMTSYSSAYLWDGTPDYETPANMGH